LQMARPIPVPGILLSCASVGRARRGDRNTWGRSDAVIAHREDQSLPSAPPDMDPGWFSPVVLDGVSDQILKELSELHFVGNHDRQVTVGHFSALSWIPILRLAIARSKACKESVPQIPSRATDAGKGQQVIDQRLHPVAPSTANAMNSSASLSSRPCIAGRGAGYSSKPCVTALAGHATRCRQIAAAPYSSGPTPPGAASSSRSHVCVR